MSSNSSKRKERKIKLVEDNGVTTNMQPKTFDGLKANYGTWLTYFKSLLMVKNLEDVILPEFKNELPETETADGQKPK